MCRLHCLRLCHPDPRSLLRDLLLMVMEERCSSADEGGFDCTILNQLRVYKAGDAEKLTQCSARTRKKKIL